MSPKEKYEIHFLLAFFALIFTVTLRFMHASTSFTVYILLVESLNSLLFWHKFIIHEEKKKFIKEGFRRKKTI